MHTVSDAAATRPGLRPDGDSARVRSAAPHDPSDGVALLGGRPVAAAPRAGEARPGVCAVAHRLAARPAVGHGTSAGLAPRGLTRPGRLGARAVAEALTAARDPYARLARGCRPRGCRAPARRVHGRRVRYVIGDEPGQVNGMRWRRRLVRLNRR
ncbi:hypothetical protein ABT032_27615 [Streptomyces flaveus]